MSEARHKTLLRKSISACVAAIEIYNMPGDNYPERSASIMMSGLRACVGRA
jgi:hypothetical protein